MGWEQYDACYSVVGSLNPSEFSELAEMAPFLTKSSCTPLSCEKPL